MPNSWDDADLMVGDVFIQNFPLTIRDPIICTIEGDLIPMDSTSPGIIKWEEKNLLYCLTKSIGILFQESLALN